MGQVSHFGVLKIHFFLLKTLKNNYASSKQYIDPYKSKVVSPTLFHFGPFLFQYRRCLLVLMYVCIEISKH